MNDENVFFKPRVNTIHNDENDMHEDEGSEVDVEEIQRINNTENDILEALTNIILEYREGIYC